MALESVIEQFSADINITRARYAELLNSEQDACRLRNLIQMKASKLDGISYSEVRFLADVLGINYKDPLESDESGESEGAENG